MDITLIEVAVNAMLDVCWVLLPPEALNDLAYN